MADQALAANIVCKWAFQTTLTSDTKYSKGSLRKRYEADENERAGGEDSEKVKVVEHPASVGSSEATK
jgi:hypothetical protein